MELTYVFFAQVIASGQRRERQVEVEVVEKVGSWVMRMGGNWQRIIPPTGLHNCPVRRFADACQVEACGYLCWLFVIDSP
jgi:hypothetical protein